MVTLYDWERLNPGDWGRHVVAYGQVVGRVARGATLPEDVVCNDPRINAVHIWLRTPRLAETSRHWLVWNIRAMSAWRR